MGKWKEKVGEKWNAKAKAKRKIVCDFCGKEMPGYDYVDKIYGHLICKSCMDRIHLETRLENDKEVRRLEEKIGQYGKLILAAGAILVLILSLFRKVMEDGVGQTAQLLCVVGMGIMIILIVLFAALRNLCNQKMVDVLNNER